MAHTFCPLSSLQRCSSLLFPLLVSFVKKNILVAPIFPGFPGPHFLASSPSLCAPLCLLSEKTEEAPGALWPLSRPCSGVPTASKAEARWASLGKYKTSIFPLTLKGNIYYLIMRPRRHGPQLLSPGRDSPRTNFCILYGGTYAGLQDSFPSSMGLPMGRSVTGWQGA